MTYEVLSYSPWLERQGLAPKKPILAGSVTPEMIRAGCAAAPDAYIYSDEALRIYTAMRELEPTSSDRSAR